MNEKQLLFKDDARLKLKKGMDTVADAVKTTLGPRGRNVVIDKSFGSPTITKDGVSVAREIILEDKFENLGAQIIKEAASKTNDVAGDGTTTATILTQAICAEGLKLLASGINPIEIRTGLEKRTKEIVDKLKKMSKIISTKEEISQVASISANDAEIGKIISETMDEVGKDGIITIDDGQNFGVEREVVKGMKLDKGYISPYFVTNHETLKVEIKNPYIIITDKKISSANEIIPLLDKILKSGKKDILIVADDVEGEALATVIVNKLKGNVNIACIKAPGFGDRKKEMLEDLAILTKGQVISESTGVTFDKVELIDLGEAQKAIVGKDNTIIVGGQGYKNKVSQRIEQIKEELKNTKSKVDKENLRNRLGKLSGGVAVIKVGAATETEAKEKKDRIEDALNATSAAVEEGVVPGGGLALLLASQQKDDGSIGSKIINEAVLSPIKTIANNAGKDGSLILYNVLEKNKDKNNIGYNVATDTFEEMIESGIIDPTKVVRNALENATSSAMMFLTTEVAIVEKPQEKKED